MKQVSGILTVLLLAACAGMSRQPPPRATLGIAVTPLDEGRLMGGRAVYTVQAPLEVVRREVLDFEAQPAYRPSVLEARLLEATEEGGEVWFRFRGAYGVEPRASCVFTVAEPDEGTVAIAWEMTNSSMALWALRGGFTLRRIDEERTWVRQEFLVSAPIMDREGLLADLRTDAAAIADHVEAAAARE
jgi:hypothetical protein